MDHDLNVVGALVVALGDRMRDAAEDAAGMGGAFPAALVALHEWAGGRTIETLAGGLRLSHSRTVRVIDRLEAAGLAARARATPQTAAACWCDLTPAGRGAGQLVLDARAAALEAGVSSLAAAIAATRGDRRAASRGRDHGPARRRGDLPPLRCPRLRSRRRTLPGYPRCGRGRGALTPQSGGGTARSPSSSQIRCSMS